MTNSLLETPTIETAGRLGDDPIFASRSMWAIGTTCTVVVSDPDRADAALDLLAEDLSAIDRACSRFRPDSELRLVERDGGGAPVCISRLLFDALDAALDAAVKTAGIVDPTVGSALVELGYDRDFEEIAGGCEVDSGEPCPAPGWWQVTLNREETMVTIPAGVHVDLGATAKAFAADCAAERIASNLGCGVLVNLGGDVAVAGPAPLGGWPIGIAPVCTASLDEVDETVAIYQGGLATSGTTARSWTANGRRLHHIVDPWTGAPALPVWSLVSVAGSSCVEANAWSTAAIVWGFDAIGNLANLDVDARLVAAGGDILRLGDWPQPDGRPAAAWRHGRAQ
jgi:thiamine biosynthesis lipoprotein